MANDSNQWHKGRKRDDTPTFIRKMRDRDALLGSPASSQSLIPVLEVPRSVRIWQKVRWPLFAAVSVCVLVAVGMTANEIIVSRNVDQRIDDSFLGERWAQVTVLLESNRALADLAQRYPKRTKVQAAYAWNCVLLSSLFDESEQYLPRVRTAMERIRTDDSPLAMAATAGYLVLRGKHDEAESVLDRALARHPDEPRLYFVQALLTEARGDHAQTVRNLLALRKRFPDYLPPVYALIDEGFATGDHASAALYATELLKATGGNLYGDVAALLAALPSWSQEGGSPRKLADIVVRSEKITARLTDDVPRKLRVFGAFLKARIALERGEVHKAVKRFRALLPDKYGLHVAAWYARAVLWAHGPKKALEALRAFREIDDPYLWDIRARAYLENYATEQARHAIEKMEDAGMDTGHLRWVLAVRTGDLAGAMERLAPVGGVSWPVAMELYEQLVDAGDAAGIARLRDSLAEGADGCAEALNMWHGDAAPRELVQYFSSASDPCAVVVAMRVAGRFLTPESAAALRDAHLPPLLQSNRRIQLDRALALWRIEGHAAALAQVDQVAQQASASPYLAWAVAKAYAALGAADRVARIAADHGVDPVAAVQLAVLRARKDTKAWSALLQAKQGSSHPGIAVQRIAALADEGANEEVVAAVDALLPRAGRFAAQAAELKALAMNAMGERGDADRFLLQAARKAAPLFGVDQSWEIKLAAVRLNLRRGGPFLFKAVGLTLEMYKQRVPHPEVPYSYAVESARQGNLRGALRYLYEALSWDPTFLPAYQQLYALGELSDERRAQLERMIPGAPLE